MDNDSVMDVDDICDIDNNVLNEDEIHGIGRYVNGNNNDHMAEEDHVPPPTGSEVNVISQQASHRKKQVHRCIPLCGETTTNNQVNQYSYKQVYVIFI